MKYYNKWLSLLLVLAILLCNIPFGALTLNAETVYQITTLNGVELHYDYDLEYDGLVITYCNSTISGDVVIPSEINGSSVTSINKDAFSNCNSMTSVVIPNTVIKIGAKAFYNCKSLKTITIPNSLNNIFTNAFTGCSSLEAVYISDLAAWCDIYFENSHANPLFMAHNLYINGELATDIVIPQGVTFVKQYAFNYCTSLKSLDFSNTVTSISNDAFRYCNGLNSVTIPESITAIDSSAFSDCPAIKNVNINNLAAWCGIDFASAYSNPIRYAKNLYLNGELVTDIVIPEGVEEIKKYTFYNCTSIKNITIPKSLKSIGIDAFYGSNSIDSVCITDLAAWCNIDFYDEDSNPMVLSDLYINGVLATDIVIPDSVEEIKKYSFYSCKSITSVTIPDSVKTIGNSAFASCNALAELKIGKNITSIGTSAFYNDEILKVYITNLAGWCGIDFKNDYANPLVFAENFYINGEDVTDIVIPDGVEEIKQYAFHNFDEMTTLKLSDTVKKIGSYAFSSCNSLKKVDLGSGIENIDVNAFNSCNALEEVHIGNMSVWFNINFGNKQANPLGNQAELYANGYLVTDIVIPNYVTVVKSYAFIGCTSLESVTTYDTLKTIGMQAFAECYSLKKVKLDNSSLVTVSKYAFEGCTALEELHITDIAKWCATTFENNSSNPLMYTGKFYINNIPVTTLVIPDGVTAIGMYAFINYTDLVEVIIPESVITIDNYAFDKCTSLETVYYKEELEKWKNIKIRSSGNTYLLNADLISIKEPLLAGDIDVDGEVKASDITLLRNLLLEGKSKFLYDVNKDSKVDIRDLVRIKKISAGIVA